jgi:hypothetical protein
MITRRSAVTARISVAGSIWSGDNSTSDKHVYSKSSGWRVER